MKKHIFFILLLSACSAKPYACYEASTKSTLRSNGGNIAICIPNEDDIKLVQQNYSQEDFNNFAGVAKENFCWTESNHYSDIFADYYVYKSNGKLIDSYDVNICPTGIVDRYEQFVFDEKQSQIAAEKQSAAERTKIAKALKQHPHVRSTIKKMVNDSCVNVMKKGAVKFNSGYVSSVCKCLACVYDEAYGIEGAYAFIESGGKNRNTASTLAMMITDSHSNQCSAYYLKESSFDPCKWAKGLKNNSDNKNAF